MLTTPIVSRRATVEEMTARDLSPRVAEENSTEPRIVDSFVPKDVQQIHLDDKVAPELAVTAYQVTGTAEFQDEPGKTDESSASTNLVLHIPVEKLRHIDIPSAVCSLLDKWTFLQPDQTALVQLELAETESSDGKEGLPDFPIDQEDEFANENSTNSNKHGDRTDRNARSTFRPMETHERTRAHSADSSTRHQGNHDQDRWNQFPLPRHKTPNVTHSKLPDGTNVYILNERSGERTIKNTDSGPRNRVNSQSRARSSRFYTKPKPDPYRFQGNWEGLDSTTSKTTNNILGRSHSEASLKNMRAAPESEQAEYQNDKERERAIEDAHLRARLKELEQKEFERQVLEDAERSKVAKEREEAYFKLEAEVSYLRDIIAADLKGETAGEGQENVTKVTKAETSDLRELTNKQQEVERNATDQLPEDRSECISLNDSSEVFPEKTNRASHAALSSVDHLLLDMRNKHRRTYKSPHKEGYYNLSQSNFPLAPGSWHSPFDQPISFRHAYEHANVSDSSTSLPRTDSTEEISLYEKILLPTEFEVKNVRHTSLSSSLRDSGVDSLFEVGSSRHRNGKNNLMQNRHRIATQDGFIKGTLL